MQRSSRLRSNIHRAHIIRTVQFFWFPIPTLALFLHAHGYGFSELMTLKAGTSLSAMFMEVPTGYFADRLGRKFSILIGSLLCTLSSLLYLCGNSFALFFCAELILGAGLSFVSGADSALLFDSLKELNEEHLYGKIESRLSALSGFAEAIGGLIGAAVASVNLELPFLLQTVLFGVGSIVGYGLVEPSVLTHSKKMSSIKDLRHVMHTALWTDMRLRYLIYISALIGIGTYATVFFAQLYMQLAQLPVVYFGMAWAVFHIVLGVASIAAEGLDQRIGACRTLALLSILITLCYALLSFGYSLLGLAVISLIYALRGLRQPLIRKWINALTSSEVRATVISSQNFLIRVGFVVLGPVMGYAVDRFSLAATLLTVAAIMAVGFSFLLPRLFRHYPAEASTPTTSSAA